MADERSAQAPAVPEIRFEIASLPPLPNAKKHWRKTTKDRKQWRAWTFYASVNQKPPKPFEIAQLELIRFSSSQPDYDGLVASFKPIIDGLVDAKILANDRPSNIGIPKYHWLRCPQKQGKVRITVKGVV